MSKFDANGFQINSERGFKDCHQLHIAVSDRNFATVRQLLDAGVPVDLRDKTCAPWTALHYACDNQSINIAHLLLDRGADINSLVQDGKAFFPPLMLALGLGQAYDRHWGYGQLLQKRIPMTRLLLEERADTDLLWSDVRNLVGFFSETMDLLRLAEKNRKLEQSAASW